MNPKFVDVKGIKTRYMESGSGKPIVLIHGGQYGSNSNAYNWKLNFEGLSKHFHVYAIDKFGMGYTDMPQSDEEYTMEPLLKHTYNFLDAVGIEKTTLVGHSRGGLLATRVAADHNERVSTLVIVDSGSLAPSLPSGGTNFHQDLGKKMEGQPTMEKVEIEPIMYSYSRKHITQDYLDELFKIAQLPKIMEAKEKMKVLGGKMFYPSVGKVKGETLKMLEEGKLKAPTLIIWGLNDPSADVRTGLALAQIVGAKISKTQMHILNEAGH
ncbi:MAG: alpha/beta fold hydrolase, partial [Nitrososphaerales archaeon]